MRRFTILTLFVLPFTGSAQTKDGFVPLFNGKDLDGWEIRQSKKTDLWSVKDGIVIAKPGSGGGWIGTKKMYGDFVLKLEWKIYAGGNSGVFIRVPDEKLTKSPSYHGLEFQILDDEDPKHKNLMPFQYCGGLYHFQGVSKKTTKGVEKWNAYEITCKGDSIQLVFNGEKVIDADASKDPVLAKRPKRGFIGLQHHGTGVEFKNVMIKTLD